MKNFTNAICLLLLTHSAALAVDVVGSRNFTDELSPMTEPWTFSSSGGETAVVNISARIQRGKSITVNANVEVAASTGVKSAYANGNMITDAGASIVVAATSKFETGFDAGRYSGSSVYSSGGARLAGGARSFIDGRFYVNGYRWNPANDEWHADNYALYLAGGAYTFTKAAEFRQRGYSGIGIDSPRPIVKIANTTIDARSQEGSLRFDEAVAFDNSTLRLYTKNPVVSGACFGAKTQADSIFEIRSAGGGSTLNIEARAANEIGAIRYADGSKLYIDVSALDGKTPDKTALIISRLIPITEGAKIDVYVDFGASSRHNIAIGNIKKLVSEGSARLYFKNSQAYQSAALGVNARVESGGYICWANGSDEKPDRSARTAEIVTVYTDGSKSSQVVNLEVSPDDPAAWRYRVPKESLPAGGTISRINVFFENSKAVKGEPGYFILGDSRLGTFRLDTASLSDVERTVMPVFGFKTPRETWVAIVKGLRLEYDIKVEAANGVYQIYPSFKIAAINSAALGQTCAYEDLIVDFYPLPDTAEYCDMGRVYRNYQLSRGGLQPLRERVKTNPKLKYTAESVFFRMKMGWKNNAENIEDQIRGVNEPPLYVQFTFAQTRQTLQKLYDLGVKDVEACFVGWGAGGFEGDYPDLHPIPEKFGGEEEMKASIQFAKSLGYQTSCHIDQTDFYTIADRFDIADITQNAAGNYVKGGMYWNGRAWKPCFRRVFEKYFPEDCEYMKSLGIDGMMHIDVTSCIRPYDCFHPDHPCSRQDTADYMNRIGDLCRQHFGGFTSEGPCDHVARTLDYALYTFAWPSYVGKSEPIIDTIVPFWQSVYHGIILSNPFYSTIDYSYERSSSNSTYGALTNKKIRRLKFFEFGGRPTFYFAINPTVNLAPVLEAYKEYQPVKYLQYEYIEEHRQIGAGVYLTGYSDGSEIVVNYGETPFEYGGKTVAPLDFRLYNPRNVSIAGGGKVQAGKPFALAAECDAVGATYQWYKDGAAIAGATSKTLEVADGSHSGVYRVEITKRGKVYASEDYAVAAAPTRIYVSAGASAGGDGYSWAAALPDLKSALAKAGFINCVPEIWVAGGTYNFGETLQIASPVKIIGGFAGGETSPSQRPLAGARTVFAGGGARALFEALQTCGVLAFDSVRFEGGNSAAGGGAVYSMAAQNIFENCDFYGNVAAGAGGAVRVDSQGGTARFANCSFAQNSAADGGAAHCACASARFENCTFYGNAASAGGGALKCLGAAAEVCHSTFAANTAEEGGAARAEGGSLKIENSILWGDAAPQDAEISAQDAEVSAANSVVAGGFAGGENIADADPQLGAYALAEFANVCVMRPSKTGAASGLARAVDGAPAADAAGLARAFPCYAGAAESAGIGASVSAPSAGESFKLFVSGFSDASYKWYKDGALIAGASGNVIEVSQGAGTARYRCVVEGGFGAASFELLMKTKAPSVVYVSTSGSDSADGLSWASAKATLAGALALFSEAPAEPVVVRMEAGQYNIASKITVKYNNIKVVGGFSRLSESDASTSEFSVIDAGAATRVFSFAQGLDQSAAFENIVFQNARGDGAVAAVSSNSSMLFKNCVFRNNSTNGNGGAFNITAGAPVFESCRFESNAASYAGGALYMRGAGAVALRNCLFIGNKAAIASAIVCNATNAVLQNCTFVENTHALESGSTHVVEISNSAETVFDSCTMLGGGTARETCAIALYSGSSALVNNCILWNWRPTCASAVRISSASASVENCVIDTGFAGGVNVYAADPELGGLVYFGAAGALPIGYDASAAWTGQAGAFTLDADAAGNPRAQPICIGALELARGVWFVNSPRSANAYLGSAVSFSADVAVEGGGNPDWLNWEKSSDGGATWQKIDGAVLPNYSISSASAGDAGLYRCTVSAGGSVAHSAAAKLSVGQAITISSNPQSLNVAEGASATFSASASGGGLAYQWQSAAINGAWADIEGATSASYTIPSVDASRNGLIFRCKVSNGSVSAYSGTAELRVLANPEISGSVSASETFVNGYITMRDGAKFYVDQDTKLESVRVLKDAAAEIYISDSSVLHVANTSNYIFGSSLSSQNKGGLKIGGSGSVSLSGGEKISNIDVDFGAPVSAFFNSITLLNANVVISADWTGARFQRGADSSLTIRNGVSFETDYSFMNFYATSSSFSLGEPSEARLSGGARARLRVGSSSESGASVYMAGKSYINGYMAVSGYMKVGSQCCTVFLASGLIDESAEIVQESVYADIPVIFGSQTFVEDGTAGVVSRAAEGALKFNSRVYITDGAKLELQTSNAFRIGMTNSGYNLQSMSVFTVSDFNQAAAVSESYAAAMGPANAKLVLGAPNDVGAFEFYPDSSLEITLNGNRLNVGKFALVPEADGGSFTIKINDYAPNLVRISGMTEGQIRALNIVDAQGNALEFTLVPASEGSIDDFYLDGAAAVVKSPSDAVARAGDTVPFAVMCAAGSGGISYQWQRSDDGGLTWHDIDGANAQKYEIEASFADANARFRCAVSDGEGSSTSGEAVLAVFGGAVVYVSPDGDNSSGASWQSAYKTVQTAVSKAPANAQIWIKSGTYAFAGSCSVSGKNLELIGGFAGTETDAASRAGGETVFTSNNSGGIISARNGSSVLLRSINFAGSANSAALYVNNSAVYLRFCRFADCASPSNGGAIYAENSSSVNIKNCEFENCHTNWAGGAIFLRDSSGKISNAYFGGCYSYMAGLFYLTGSTLKAENITAYNCFNAKRDTGIPSNGYIVYALANSSITANFCTLVQRSDVSSGLFNLSASSAKLSNSIVWGVENTDIAQGEAADFSRSITNYNSFGGKNILKTNPQLEAPAYVGGAFVRAMVPAAGGSADGFGASPNCAFDAVGKPRAVPLCTAGAFELSESPIVVADGESVCIGENVSATAARVASGGAGGIFISSGAELALSGGTGYLLAPTSSGRGSLQISGAGVLKISAGEKINGVNAVINTAVKAPVADIQVLNSSLSIGGDWVGTRLSNGYNSSITIQNGVEFKSTSTYMNLYATSSSFGVGEPSETTLGGAERARLYLGASAYSAASLYCMGKAYINGYVEVNGAMATALGKSSAQFCTVLLADAEIDKSAEILQNSVSVNIPAVFGRVGAENPGVVSRAAEGALKFTSRAFITDTAKLELRTSNAFNIGKTGGEFNAQGVSTFTVSAFDATKVTPERDITAAIGAARAKLVLGASNDIGAFEFHAGSELEITLGGNVLNVGKFALMPECASGEFTIRINDFGNGALRVSNMTAPQIRALNIVDALGNKIQYSLTAADAQSRSDFWLGAGVGILRQPRGVSALEGETAVLSIEASGAASYRWQKYGGGAWNDIAGANAKTLSMPATLANAGKYRCVVSSGGVEVASAPAALEVFAGGAVYVSPDGDNSDGSSWARAYAKLETALAAAPANSRIFVKSGTYVLGSALGVSKNVAIIGGFAGDGAKRAGIARIDCAASGYFAHVSGASVLLENLEIRNAATHSAISANAANMELNRCRFIDCAINATANGGAIYAENGSCLCASSCEFENCSTKWAGGAVFLRDSSGDMDAVYIGGCSALYGGAVYLNNSSLSISNATLFENYSTNSVSVVNISGSSLSVASSTIAQRAEGTTSTLLADAASSFAIKNSIVWGNTSAAFSAAELEAKNCIVDTGCAGENISTANPELSAPAYSGSSFVRTMAVQGGGVAVGFASTEGVLFDACGRPRAVPNSTAGAFEFMPAYDQWAYDAGLSGANMAFAAIPRLDGITNIEKYAFNLDASRPASYADNPKFSFTSGEGGATLRFQSRAELPGGAEVRAFVSHDLVNWTRADIVVERAEGGFNECRVSAAPDASGRVFVRLKIEMPE